MPILRGDFFRLGELRVLQNATSVKRLNADDRYFVDQMNGFAVVDKRHERRAVIEEVLNPGGCIDKNITAENRAIGQRKLGIFANFRYFLMCIQGRTHGRDFNVRMVNEG